MGQPIYTIIVKTPPFNPNLPVEQVEGRLSNPQFHAGNAAAAGVVAADKKDFAAEEPNTNLLTDEFPAPSAAIWKSVSQLLASGIKNLPRGSVIGMIIGGILGIIIALAEEFLPKRYIKWIPSATGLASRALYPLIIPFPCSWEH